MSKRARWLYPLIGVSIYALAGFLLAPWLVERTLTSTLTERLGLTTEIGALRINPFTLTLAVDELTITEADAVPLLAFERLFVNFELSGLFRWAWSFNEVHLTGARLDFERFSEADTNFSRLAEAWAASSEPAAVTDTTTDSAEDNGLIRLIISDLRIVDGLVEITDQMPEEPFTTRLAPIDLAVADLSTLPDASGTQRVTISTEDGASVAWTGTLSVNPLALTGQVTIEGTYTPLVFRYLRDQLQLPLNFDGGAIEASLTYAITVDEAGSLAVQISGLTGTLTNLVVTQPDLPELVKVGSFSVTGGLLRWPEQVVHLDDIHFDEVAIDAYADANGRYLPTAGPEDPASLDAAEASVAESGVSEPTPPEPESSALTENDPWQISAGQLRLTRWEINHTDTRLENGRIRIEALNLSVQDLANTPGTSMVWRMDLTMAEGGRLEGTGTLQVLPDIALAADLQGTELALAILQPYLSSIANIGIDSGSASLKGTFTSTPTSTPERAFSYLGEFSLNDLHLIDRIQEETLLSWKRLAVDQLALTPGGMEISALSVVDPYARIEIEQDGSTNIERTLLPREPVAAATEDAADGEAPGTFALVIGRTTLSNGSARFTDLGLPLPFEASIANLTGGLSTLSSTSSEPARINLEGQVNEYGQLLVAGTLQPFALTRGTDVQVQFENVDLPRMSPYTIKFAGRKIADGRTDLDLRYQLVDGQVKGSNRLVIRNLKLGERVEHPDAMDLPLDLAVALLKDPSGVVDFNFPVSGALGDPAFSFGGAVAKAFSNLILGLATSPFRLLGSLVGLAAEDVGKVAFLPGRSDLSPPQREVLDQLASALSQRPQLVLEIPPVMDPDADRQALQGAGLDAEVSELLAQGAADEPQTDAMLAERRRLVLERLYDEAQLLPARSELKTLHSPPDPAGTPTLDTLAYAEALRSKLIAAREIPASALAELATARADAVVAQLASAGIPSGDRLITLARKEQRINKDGEIRMSLELTVND